MTDADDAGDSGDPEGPDEQGPVRDVVRVDGPELPDEADGDDERPSVGREGVMDPDELDIRGRDGVEETNDGRYVISTAGENPVGRPDRGRDDGHDRGRDDRPDHGHDDPDDVPDYGHDDSDDVPDGSRDVDEDPLEAVAEELGALSASHGFAIAVAAGSETDTLRVASGEPTDTLSTALRWYARRVDPDRPPEETIAALLASSDLDVG